MIELSCDITNIILLYRCLADEMSDVLDSRSFFSCFISVWVAVRSFF